MNTDPPQVTIGVPTFERPAELARCLAALSAQTCQALGTFVTEMPRQKPKVLQ